MTSTENVSGGAADYMVTATRWDGGWELDIDGVGVTQSATLAGAERMVRSYLAMDDHADAQTASVQLRFHVGDDIDAALEEARDAAAAAARARDEAAALSREAARRLLEVMSGQDAARVLGVSPQRVSQLTA